MQMQNGMGSKVGVTISNICTLLGGLAVGFYYKPALAAVIISFLPLTMMAGGILKVRRVLGAVYSAVHLLWRGGSSVSGAPAHAHTE